MLTETHLLKPGDEAMLIDAASLYNEVELSQADAAALLRDPAFVMVAALDEQGTVMGRIYGYVLRRLDQTDLFLYEVDVSDAYQRQGAGRAMLEHLKAICKDRNYGEMFVLTECDNQAGNGLYNAAGSTLEGSPANVHVFFTTDK
jgi:ribosomal protein S18 acetylase RimI-like enzyme